MVVNCQPLSLRLLGVCISCTPAGGRWIRRPPPILTTLPPVVTAFSVAPATTDFGSMDGRGGGCAHTGAAPLPMFRSHTKGLSLH